MEKEDVVEQWMKRELTPAVSEASVLLYEYGTLELRDLERAREMLWKLSTLNHRLGMLYATAVELKGEFQIQCDELYSQVLLLLSSKKLEYRLTVESAKAGAELATSNIEALLTVYPDVARVLNVEPGDEPKRKLNQIAATIEKLKSLQRDMTESINGIKHLGNRDMQHAVHGI